MGITSFPILVAETGVDFFSVEDVVVVVVDAVVAAVAAGAVVVVAGVVVVAVVYVEVIGGILA